jgi:chromosome partitioning protein
MKISILSQKGGVGKTTLSIHLCHALSLKGFNPILIDSDPQGSSLDWSLARQGERLFPVVALDRPIIHKELPRLMRGYEFAVVDGAPRLSDLTRSAIMASDLIVIPVQPSPLDVWAIHEVVTLIEEARVYNDSLKAVFLVSRKIVNTAIARDFLEVLDTYNIPILESQIAQRVVFAESLASGSTVLEIAPFSQAAKEIRQLCKEILIYAKENINHDQSISNKEQTG